jgi:phosphoglycolate phosphatase-like HAD superfamily hydrolase
LSGAATRLAKVVLWDIDGTLVRTAGIGVKAFATAVEQVTGIAWQLKRLDFGGRTDPEIAGLILADAGVDDADLVAPVLVALGEAYAALVDELHAAVRVLPGVDAALTELGQRGATQTVVTGNIKVAAGFKVAAGKLDHHLRLDLGGYGSDHAVRAELVRLALQRAGADGIEVRAEDVWVVGDTPRDLACATANGVRCALVATGAYPIEQLSDLGADLVLDDLGDPTALLDAIAAG